MIHCEPPLSCRQEPFHWVQWETTSRIEPPQPWTWDNHTSVWRTATGAVLTPERAGHMRYKYLAPARPPLETLDEQRQRMVAIELARVLTAQHFADRFNKSLNDPLVQAAVDDRWEQIGLPRVRAVLDTVMRLHLQ